MDPPPLEPVVMTNPIVLTHIATHLRARDLLDLRPTCLQWNSSFIPHLRLKHRPIELEGAAPWVEKSVQKVSEAMRSRPSSTGNPFSNFSIMNCEAKQGLTDFGVVCGSLVTKLHVHFSLDEHWKTSSIHRAIFEQMPRLTELELEVTGIRQPSLPSPSSMTMDSMKLPALKRFRFTFTGSASERSRSRSAPLICAGLVSNLVRAATRLESLQLPLPSTSTSTMTIWSREGVSLYQAFLLSTLERIRDSNANTHIYKLKKLSISEVSRPILQTLLELAKADRKGMRSRLCLEIFSICVTGTGDEFEVAGANEDEEEDRRRARHRLAMEQALKAFLSSQAPKLKELTLWLKHSNANDENVTPIVLPLPQLERLRTMVVRRVEGIHGSMNENTRRFDLQFDGDSFYHAFPALKKLEFYVNVNSYSGFQDPTHISHPGVIELIVDTPVNRMVDLPTLFPSVTRLEINMREKEANVHARAHARAHASRTCASEEYAKLWTLWPGLISLRLTVDCLADGLSPDEFLTGLDSMETKKRASILDLDRLEEFTLVFRDDNSGEEWSGISDLGVYSGLALLGPQLRSIKVSSLWRPNPSTSTTPALISQHGLEYLKSVIGSNVLIRID